MAIRIGIIGSGSVGVTLANGFLKHGYDVMIGTNTNSKKDDLARKTGNRAQVGSFADTAAFGSVIVLAVKGTAAEEAVRSAGLQNFNGKTIIDTTNPIADAPPVNGVIRYFTGPNESLMERLQKLVPEARFVKCFSSVGAGLMVNPDLPIQPSMFICGSDSTAKQEVTGVLVKFGWETLDMGDIEAARAIEPLAMLWCIPGFRANDWLHAFKMLKK